MNFIKDILSGITNTLKFVLIGYVIAVIAVWLILGQTAGLGTAGIGALVVIGAVAKLRNRDRELIRGALSRIGIDPKQYANFKYNYTTPQGAQVQSTVPVPADFLTIYDASIQRVVRNHTRVRPEWKQFLTVPDYPLLLVDPMTTNVETDPGSPALFVEGIQTAGTVIGTSPKSNLSRPYLVLPHQANQSWNHREYFRQSAYNEGEHRIELNDYGVFLYYAHAGDLHPHVSDETYSLVGSGVTPPCRVPPES